MTATVIAIVLPAAALAAVLVRRTSRGSMRPLPVRTDRPRRRSR